MLTIDFDAMQRNATDAVNLLKGLANESRLMIMCVLSEGEVSVGQLNQRIKISQSALSQHLAVCVNRAWFKPGGKARPFITAWQIRRP